MNGATKICFLKSELDPKITHAFWTSR